MTRTGLFKTVLFLVGIYFAPSIIGYNKKGAFLIIICNLLFGWTLIGWVICFAWSAMSTNDQIDHKKNIDPTTLQFPR